MSCLPILPKTFSIIRLFTPTISKPINQKVLTLVKTAKLSNYFSVFTAKIKNKQQIFAQFLFCQSIASKKLNLINLILILYKII